MIDALIYVLAAIGAVVALTVLWHALLILPALVYVAVVAPITLFARLRNRLWVRWGGTHEQEPEKYAWVFRWMRENLYPVLKRVVDRLDAFIDWYDPKVDRVWWFP